MGDSRGSVPASAGRTTPDPQVSAGDRPGPPISESNEKAYPPRQAKTLRAVGLLVGFGLLAAVSLAHDITQWAHGGAAPAPRSVLLGFATVFLLGLGFLSLVGSLRGLPRLTLTAAGVRLETIFGTRWASWSSLEPFREATLYKGRVNRRVRGARSAIVGTEASAGVRRKKLLDIPDAFLVPIDDIIADLNARRAQVLGVAPTLRWAIRSDEDERKFGVPGFKAPWLTIGILVALCLTFALEQIYPLGPAGGALRPSTVTLVALGALNRSIMVSTGEWYRLFTAPMLHLDLAHLLLNSLAFLMIGILLERLVGRAWFLACFMTGALGGSALSLALNPASTTSVGASGAIMGLFAAAFVSSYRVPLGTLTRQRIQSRSIQVLIPSLIPLYTTSATGHIDYAAHIGGALSGAAAGFFLLRAWPDTNPLPRFRNLAAGVAATGMLLILGSGAGVVSHYSRYEALAYLIPQGQVPKTADLTLAGSADLVTRYPRDPRAHLLRGTALIQVRDNTDAEAELRTALSEAEALTFFFGDAVADGARTALAVVLQEEGRAQEAKETARPLCLARGDARSEKLRKLLFDERLCD